MLNQMNLCPPSHRNALANARFAESDLNVGRNEADMSDYTSHIRFTAQPWVVPGLAAVNGT